MTSVFSRSQLKSSGCGLLAPSVPLMVDIGQPLKDIVVGPEYYTALVLVRLHGDPVGSVIIPVHGDRCRAVEICEAVSSKLATDLLRVWARQQIQSPLPKSGLSLRHLLAPPKHDQISQLPRMTVALCTRNRPELVENCLADLSQIEYPNYEILLVDNAPSDNAVRELAARYDVRYVREEKPGLSYARDTAVSAASGEIIAFTDDDVSVDKDWLRRLVIPFIEDPTVAAVTGLIVPLELRYEAQIILETNWSYDRGCVPRWYRIDPTDRKETSHFVAYQYGAGANMAFRRSMLKKLGPFDPALGAGSATGAGEDMDMFFRVLEYGATLAYQPAAIVRHRHRDNIQALKRQVVNWGLGYSAFLTRTLCTSHRRWRLAGFFLQNWSGQVRTLLRSLAHPGRIPDDLLRAQIATSFRGIPAYFAARRRLRRAGVESPRGVISAQSRRKDWSAVAVRSVDLTRVITDLSDVSQYRYTRIYICVGARLIGAIEICNQFLPISRAQLLDTVAEQHALHLLPAKAISAPDPNAQIARDLRRRLLSSITASPSSKTHGTRQPQNLPKISVVIATRDRPDLLRMCLLNVTKQQYTGEYEVLVADNNPRSGLTAPVIEEFPQAKLVSVQHGGASAARNSAMSHSDGQIISMIDDDVMVPPQWLNSIASGFERNDVHLLTGQVLPVSLKTKAERWFERYVGLGKGVTPKEFGVDVFEASAWRPVPVWEFGAGANLSLRRSILREVKEMSELLGPGTPTGAGEDLYLMYCVAKAGFTILYRPDIYVYHQHRSSMHALLKQMFQYGKGHYAFQINTLISDGDFRALSQIFCIYPLIHMKRFLTGDHPRSLVVLEWIGNFLGPISYLGSYLTKQRRTSSVKPSNELPQVPSD